MNGPFEYIATGVDGGFSTDGACNLLYEMTRLLAQEHRLRGAKFVMSFRTAATLAKMKDNDGSHLLNLWAEAGMMPPHTMLGYGVETDNTMPDISSGSFSIAFGCSREIESIANALPFNADAIKLLKFSKT
jgi:HK97 family phage major capsid protein